jgi:hypothetical protein
MESSFYNRYLTGQEFVLQMRDDLENALQLNFVVAYVNDLGVNYLGKKSFLRAMNKSGSYGVTSLACGFDFYDIIKLQNDITEKDKLKLFMSLQKETGQDETQSLLHSKIVYLKILEGEQIKQVLYIGSHNWTGRALGANSNGGNNAEASLRMVFNENDSNEILRDAKKHIELAWNLKSSFPANEINKSIFSDWIQLRCPKYGRGLPTIQREPYTVLLCLTEDLEDDLISLNETPNHAAYLHIDLIEDSNKLNDQTQNVLLLIWQKPSDFENQILPVAIFCKINTINQTQINGGVNTQINPISGFDISLKAMEGATYTQNARGVEANFWNFKIYKEQISLTDLSFAGEALKQVLLKVEKIIFPETYPVIGNQSHIYSDGELCFLNQIAPQPQNISGIATGSIELNDAIKAEMVNNFNIQPTALTPKLIEIHGNPKSGYRLSKEPMNKLTIGNPKSVNSYFAELPINSFSEVADFETINQNTPTSIPRISLNYLESFDQLIEKFRV